MFDPKSRYFDLPDLTYTAPNGREIVYKERRLVPRTPARLRTTLAQSERLDLVAARTQGDAQLFWRICDANEELDPFRMQAQSGRTLKLPDGDG